MSHAILVVDDDESTAAILTEAMARSGLALTWQPSAARALEALDERDFEVMVTDLSMPGMDGLALCERVVANRPDLPVILMTAFGNLEAAISAIRAGAFDFVTKPFDAELFRFALERAVQHRALRVAIKRLQELPPSNEGFDDLLGSSSPIKDVKDVISRVSDSEAALLISGESGSGKELVARAVHERSRRRAGPFVAINCAAIPEQLLESELFGHVKGAFTDARATRQGLFLKASGGTLFLDEIGDMPAGMQPKLLRVLQERTVRPVGGDREESYDARIITATNRNLEVEVHERRFREDLYYRLNVVRIVVPPLRVRGSDVLLLAQHFVTQFAAQTGKAVTALSSAAAQKLVDYAWPGNVRELQNCIERAVAFARFAELTVDDLPERVRDYQATQLSIPGLDSREMLTMDEVERRYVVRLLRQVNGSKTLASEVLGLDRRTLHRKLQRWNHTSSAGSGPGAE